MHIAYPLLANLTYGDYGVMGLYLLLVIAIGVWFSRGEKDTDTYLLGGRAMPWWLIGISYLVSLLSTLTMVGVPGEAYQNGVTMSIGSLILPVCAIASFHIFVRFYFMTRMFTPFDYLERRFDARIRALAGGFFWLSRVIYIGLVLYACAKVFAGADQWTVWKTILLIGAIGTAYTILGGLKAVVWSDFVQFVILAGGIVVILVVAIDAVPGGVSGIFHYAWENDRGMPHLSDPSFYSFNPTVRLTLWGLCISILNEQLFFNSSDQIALQRLLSTSSYRQARRSLYTSALLLIPVLAMLWFLGLAIFGFYGQAPADQRPQQGDLALFRFIATQLPSPLPGLILSAMLAAIMSTLDSGINSLATVATKDFYVRFFRPNATEAKQVAFSRWMTLLTGGLAILIGLALTRTSETIGATVLETTTAWLALSVALPPVFLFGMLSRRATANVALIQLIVGWTVTAAMLAWYLISNHNNPDSGISFTVVGVPGPVLSLIVACVLSRLSPRRPEDTLRNLTFWTLGKSATPEGAGSTDQRTA